MSLSPHLLKRIERIHSQISLFRVLEDYGYPIQSGYDREQQFPCDLHGDGTDGKPSARAYPGSHSWWCFACGRQRDAIATCQEKEGKTFSEAVRLLERRYNLPYLEVDDHTEAPEEFKEKSPWPDVQKRAQALLMSASTEQLLPLKVSLASWELFDKVSYLVSKKEMSESEAASTVDNLRVKLLERIQGLPNNSPLKDHK